MKFFKLKVNASVKQDFTREGMIHIFVNIQEGLERMLTKLKYITIFPTPENFLCYLSIILPQLNVLHQNPTEIGKLVFKHLENLLTRTVSGSSLS